MSEGERDGCTDDSVFVSASRGFSTRNYDYISSDKNVTGERIPLSRPERPAMYRWEYYYLGNKPRFRIGVQEYNIKTLIYTHNYVRERYKGTCLIRSGRTGKKLSLCGACDEGPSRKATNAPHCLRRVINTGHGICR